MTDIELKKFDAVLAGLRLLSQELALGRLVPNDGGIGEILTNGGDHNGLSAAEIDELADELVDQIDGVEHAESTGV